MKSGKKIWMDGKVIDWEKAKIHVFTHALHYGGAVFEGIRSYKTKNGPAVFCLEEHIKRLLFSAKAINLSIPYTQKELCQAALSLVKTNCQDNCYIRPIAYYGDAKMGLYPKDVRTNVAILTVNFDKYLGHDTAKAKISKFMRIHPKTTVPGAKISGSYYNSILASLEIRSQGFDEAILLDYKGNIAEGPGENIFIVKKGVLITTPSANILAGITRDSVFQIAKHLKLKVKIRSLKPKDLFTADEVFFTGTAAEITPVSQIDTHKIGNGQPGAITKEIKKVFTQATHGELKKFEKWLSYV